MGQQQLLLIILGVIIVGIAIAVGLSMFYSNSVQSNKDAMINDINNIAANAYQYYIRPESMAGGGNSYAKYGIPVKMSSNENGIYELDGDGDATGINIKAKSSTTPTNTITVKINSTGKPEAGTWVFGGEFETSGAASSGD